MWKLSEALDLVAELTVPLKEAGYGVGVCGSVLVKGYSTHDLDLVVFPLNTSKLSVPGTSREDALRRVGMALRHGQAVVQARWRKLGSTDEKHVEVWSYQGKRVDVFFLR